MDPGHVGGFGGFGGFDADGAVFENHAVFRRDGHEFCGEEKGFGMGLAALVVLGADDGLEQVADAEYIKRGFDEFPMAIDEPR
jgi:hypothetical protein